MDGTLGGSSCRCHMPRIDACARRVLCWKFAAGCCVLLSLVQGACVAAASYPREQRAQDSRGKRAGDVAGLEGGRISLAEVSSMLTSGIHVEVRAFFPMIALFSFFLSQPAENRKLRSALLQTCQTHGMTPAPCCSYK